MHCPFHGYFLWYGTRLHTFIASVASGGTLRIRPSSDLYALCLRVGGCVTRPITKWEHPHDSTYPPSVTQHIQFSVFPHSKTLIYTQIRPQLFPHFTSQQHTLSPISLQPALLGQAKPKCKLRAETCDVLLSASHSCV